MAPQTSITPCGSRAGQLGEKRSEEEYEAEVEGYVEAMEDSWSLAGDAIAIDWVKERRSVLGVSVRNNTEQNYENAVIELTLAGLDQGRTLPPPRATQPGSCEFPTSRKWGDMSFIPNIAARYPVAPIAALAKPRPDIEEPGTDQVLVRYPELRIRPHTPHKLEPLLLALAPGMAGQLVPVHWRVTASNADGHQEGDIDFHVPAPASSGAPEPSEAQART